MGRETQIGSYMDMIGGYPNGEPTWVAWAGGIVILVAVIVLAIAAFLYMFGSKR